VQREGVARPVGAFPGQLTLVAVFPIGESSGPSDTTDSMSTRAPRRFGDADLTESPPPPADLDTAEVAVWESVVPELVRRRVLARLDAEAVARYCRAVALEQQAQQQWDAAGRPMTAEGSTGQPRPHPLIRIIRDARGDAARLGSALLLDPASRARAGDTTPPVVSSLDDTTGPGPRKARQERDVFIAEHGEPVTMWDHSHRLVCLDGTPWPAGWMPPKITRVATGDELAVLQELYPEGPPAR
jgi:P27 family predicted phage terminase small subunit